MLLVLLAASVSFFITFMMIPVIMRVATQKRLYDLPDARKLHTRPIASLGGVGIFAGFLLTSLLVIKPGTDHSFQAFYAASVVMFFLGIKDDILIISPTKKFIGQLLAAGILVHLGGIQITSMHGLLGVYELPYSFSIALSYFTIIVVTNAFNLIDGVDGLAGMLGLVVMLCFGAYFGYVNMDSYAVLAFAMAGALAAFLIFNFNPAKIFMGDSGSLLLGLISSVLAIKFIAVADGAGVSFPIASVVAVGFSVLMLPLADTLRVFSIRIAQGRSPFSPDRNHIHHLLLDRGLNHKMVTLTCVGINLLFIAVAFYFRNLGPTTVMLMMVAMALSMLGMLVAARRYSAARRFPAVFETPLEEGRLQPKTKVVALTPEVLASEN